MILERLSFLDSLYFTIVTISTVGYGDINPSNTASKIFGIVIIIFGIGTFLTIVTTATQFFIQRGQDTLHRNRLNMIIGVFFTEVGNQLLRIFTRFDPEIDEIRQEFAIGDGWAESDFAMLKGKIRDYQFTIDSNLIELETLHSFLREKGELLLRQLENQDLVENESFTELLWSVVHLRDELMARTSLDNLPGSDIAHITGDARRAYNNLVGEWLNYLQNLKQRYPYLFSLALRTNPFSRTPSPIVQ